MNKLDILIVGVGGQGTLLASRVLGKLADSMQLDCKLSEVHGMAQRGGSVVTHVRMAKEVYSPVVSEGDCDVILAFEKLEALRYRHYLKKDGLLLVNDQEIYPMPVITGEKAYPQDVFGTLSAESINYVAVKALDIALECGNARTANTAMMGAFAALTNIGYDTIEQALRAVVAPKILDVNLRALRKGYDSVR